MQKVSDAFLNQPRADQELKDFINGIFREWEINDYYVMIVGHSSSTIYPAQKILEVGHEQLKWPEPAVVSSLLHEIGHIDRGHFLGEHDDALLNHLDEYEADEFAFDAVKTRYGYIPTSATLWLLRMYGDWRWENDSFSHPSHLNRWERLAWNGFVPEDFLPTIQELGLEKPKEDI